MLYFVIQLHQLHLPYRYVRKAFKNLNVGFTFLEITENGIKVIMNITSDKESLIPIRIWIHWPISSPSSINSNCYMLIVLIVLFSHSFRLSPSTGVCSNRAMSQKPSCSQFKHHANFTFMLGFWSSSYQSGYDPFSLQYFGSIMFSSLDTDGSFPLLLDGILYYPCHQL